MGYLVGSGGAEPRLRVGQEVVQVVTGQDPHSWRRIPSDSVLWRREPRGVFLFDFPTRNDLDAFLDWTGYGAFVQREAPEEGVPWREVVGGGCGVEV